MSPQPSILVVQAETMGALAVIRSLGRAGFSVHAASSDSSALGLHSRYAAARVCCPRYDDAGFLPWLRGYLREHTLTAVVPSEGFLWAIEPCFSEFQHLLPLAPSKDALYRGLSKYDLFETLKQESPAHLPPTLLVDTQKPPSLQTLGELQAPLFIKFDAKYSRARARGIVLSAGSADEALAILKQREADFSRAIIQGCVAGQGVGAFFLLRQGRVAARFMHRRLHEVPHRGGVSSLRESFHHTAIAQDALEKLSAMGWQGVAMVEYRWDEASDEFWLMEMNGRFWGSLHLPLHCGVDFPALLLSAHYDAPSPPQPPLPKLGVKCRHTFPGEVQHVWSKLKDGEVSVFEKLKAVAGFFLLSLHPGVKSDLAFPKDNGIYWRGLWQFLRGGVAALAGRSRKEGRHDDKRDEGGPVPGSEGVGPVSAEPPPHPKAPEDIVLSRDGAR